MKEEQKQTEQKIFESAVEVFEEKGMDGARMQDIADRAGINKSLLHYYYRSKEKLFNAVFELIATRMFKQFVGIFEGEDPFEEKIRNFFQTHISFLAKNKNLPIFFLNEIHKNPERLQNIISKISVLPAYQNLYAQYMKEVEEGKWVKVDLEQLVINTIALSVFPFAARPLIEGILMQTGSSFEAFIEERKTAAADFVLNALKKK